MHLDASRKAQLPDVPGGGSGSATRIASRLNTSSCGMVQSRVGKSQGKASIEGGSAGQGRATGRPDGAAPKEGR